MNLREIVTERKPDGTPIGWLVIRLRTDVICLERDYVSLHDGSRRIWDDIGVSLDRDEAHAVFEALGEYLGREFGAQSDEGSPQPSSGDQEKK